MRIRIVLHDFSLGGTERIAVRLAGAWAAAGAQVAIFAGSEIGPLHAMLSAQVAVQTPADPIARGKGSRRRLAAALAEDLRSEPADLCFIPGNFHWEVVPAVARLAAAPRIVAQISAALTKPQRGPWRQRAFDWRMRHLLGPADAIVAMDARSAARAQEVLKRDTVSVIPLPALDDAIPPPTPPPAGPPLIVGAGRLVPEKGFDTLIDAVALLDRPDARLAIAGIGPEAAALQARIDAAGLGDRAELLGYLPDIRPLLDRARLFVLSSHFEGYAAVVIEALAAGRPVVATDCTPATVELLGREGSGSAVPLRDPAAMARAIAAVLDAPAPNPAQLAGLVDRHRIGRAAQDYLRLFEAVCR